MQRPMKIKMKKKADLNDTHVNKYYYHYFIFYKNTHNILTRLKKNDGNEKSVITFMMNFWKNHL